MIYGMWLLVGTTVPRGRSNEGVASLSPVVSGLFLDWCRPAKGVIAALRQDVESCKEQVSGLNEALKIGWGCGQVEKLSLSAIFVCLTHQRTEMVWMGCHMNKLK